MHITWWLQQPQVLLTTQTTSVVSQTSMHLVFYPLFKWRMLKALCTNVCYWGIHGAIPFIIKLGIKMIPLGPMLLLLKCLMELTQGKRGTRKDYLWHRHPLSWTASVDSIIIILVISDQTKVIQTLGMTLTMLKKCKSILLVSHQQIKTVIFIWLQRPIVTPLCH